jgi:hypothetical protein
MTADNRVLSSGMAGIKVQRPVPWPAIVAKKRRAAERAEARAAELRAEADELEAAYCDSQAS